MVEKARSDRDEHVVVTLTEACTLLSEAIVLAAESTKSGTLGERAAWIRAERVDALLCEAVGVFGAEKELVLAASATLRRGGIKRV